MSNIFSRRKDRPEEPYVRPSLTSLQLTRTESIASDATAPNNPGPGRNLGLLFDATGEKIERLLNKLAGRYGLGTKAIVENIRNLRRYERNSYVEGQFIPFVPRCIERPTVEEYRVLKECCRKLLKHCRSHMLATQLEALEAVTTLAVEDIHLRQIFADTLHHSYLIPRYKEQDLSIRSCKAVISIKETEIYDFYLWFKAEYWHVRSDGIFGNSEINHPIQQLETHLKNPDVSFLLGRLIHCEDGMSQDIYKSYTYIASTSPHVIEWETLHKFLEKWHVWSLKDWWDEDHFMMLARQFPVLHLIGSTSGQDSRCQNDKARVLRQLSGTSLYINQFLNNLCGSEDLLTQLQYFRSLGEEKRSLFEGTMFANEILIAFVHSRKHCNEDRWTQASLTSLEIPVAVLVNYFLRGNLEQQALAEECIIQSSASSRYFKVAVSRCGVALNTARSMEPPFANCENDQLTRQEFVSNIESKLAYNGTDVFEDDVLQCPYGHDSWIKVNGDEYPFCATGHFPVLAGFDASGKETYVARFWSFLTPSAGCLHTYVSDGARSISIADSNGKVRVIGQFAVMVLKHDPCDSEPSIRDIPAGAKFQTGPIYWSRDEKGIYEGRKAPDFSWDECENWGPEEIERIQRAEKQFYTETDLSLVREGTSTGTDDQEERSEGLDNTGKVRRNVEERRKIEAEMQELTERMRRLEERKRMLELEESRALKLLEQQAEQRVLV